MRFRPCIDLHDGKVKQIVGSTLKDDGTVTTNFVSECSPSYYADLYYRDELSGGHVIMLGKGNEAAAREALSVHPGNLQIGGGITPDNAQEWLEAGAGKIIVTSYVFCDGELDFKRLGAISGLVGRDNLVLDLSCVKQSDGFYHVACNRWQTVCSTVLNRDTFSRLSEYSSEFLVHAVQVEGKQGGIDGELVRGLSRWTDDVVTYAGGISCIGDIEAVGIAGDWKVDFTVGSALDIFGGTGLRYNDLASHGSWTGVRM